MISTLSWASFKVQILPSNMIYIADSPTTYIVWATLNQNTITCYLFDPADITDFQTNYRAQAHASSTVSDIVTINAFSIANVGTTGTGVYRDTTNNTFNLKKINSTNNKLSVTDNTGNSTIDLTVNEGNINHNALLNTHNLTTDIDHNQITNHHNLTTDINHETISGLLGGATNDHQHITTAQVSGLHTHSNKTNLDAIDQNLATTSSVTFANIIDSGLTASQIVQTDTLKKLVSVTPNTAYNLPLSTALADIKMDGTASLGTNATLPRSDHVHPTDTTKENYINAGSVNQYWRGDKTWQTLNANAVGLGNVTNVAQVPLSYIGAVNGVASLDSTGKIPNGQLPALAITETFVVASQSAMLGLTAQTGDIAIRTDVSQTYILQGSDPSVLANWQLILSPASPVQSVNGQTGNVSLTTANVPDAVNYRYLTDAQRTLATQNASTSLTGLLSSTDWNTFNNKQNFITQNTGFNLNLETTSTNIKMNGTQSLGILSTLPRADHIHPIDTSREPSVSAGTTSQYYRGDKTWQTLNSTAVGLSNVTNDAQVKRTEMGSASGVATLDSNSLLSIAQLPPSAVNKTYTVATQTAMLSLSANVGDIALRTDINQTFILQSSPASTLANWKVLLTPSIPVTSVNGLTGAVVLNTGNVSEVTDFRYLNDSQKTNATQNATTSLTGLLSSTDWNTFNNKESAITKLTAFNRDFSTTTTDIKMNGTQNLGVLNTIPRADHIHPIDTSREPSVTAGTTSQYYRGDKTWQALNTSAVVESTGFRYLNDVQKTLATQNASTSLTGLLSSTDWNTFNSKENSITAGTTAQYWRGDKTWQTLNASAVGLGNVTNDAQVKRTEMGAVNGVATLDAFGKVLTSQLPSTTINNTYVVASQTAMLSLSANIGDIAIRTDINKTFILQNTPASTLANWQQLLFQDAVTSVNGQTGTVNLTTANIPEATGYRYLNDTQKTNATQNASATLTGLLSSTNWGTFNSKEPSISAGTTLQYWRGDKSWQTLNTGAVPESTNFRYLNDAQKTLATQNASTSLTGLLSSADWNTFNSKEPAITKLTAFNQNFETTTANIKMNGVVSVGVSTNIPRADHVHPTDTTKENIITVGTTTQYWRGDKSWQTLNTSVVPDSTGFRYLSDAQKTLATQNASTSLTGLLSNTDWNTFNSKEPSITAGTTAQYWRGDKTWQTLNSTAVGLGNVTNNAQVIKASSSITGNLVQWNASTGDTVIDSGISATSVSTAITNSHTHSNKVFLDTINQGLATTSDVTHNSIILSNLIASTVPYTDATKKIVSSAVTPTELGYVSGVTSSIQTQIGTKEPTITAGTTGQYWRGDKSWQTLNSTAVGLGNVTNDAQVPLSYIGTANGVAGLDATGKIPISQIPSIALVNTFVVNSQASMLALTAQTGDVCVRTDLNKTFILKVNDPTILANWQELLSPSGAVSSVNGLSGVVVLTTGNVAEVTNFRYLNDTQKINATQNASATLTGLLSSTDWTTFNNKQPLITQNTAFNQNFETSTSNIHMNGTVSVGALSTIARADHIHPSDTTREPSVSVGTTAQYYRGDKTWQTLNSTAVGLSNVTNDAQLKRSANDFVNFTSKTPIIADRFLYEDSTNGFAKVYSNLSPLINNYGRYHQFAEDSTETSTTATTAPGTTKLTMTTGVLPPGTYRIDWHSLARAGSANRGVGVRVTIDGNIMDDSMIFLASNNSSIEQPINGFDEWTYATATTHTIVMSFYTGVSPGTSYLSNARICIYAVALL